MKNKREHKSPEDRIAADVVQIAYDVHTKFGPGLLEGAYQTIFCFLLRKKGYKVETEVSVPIEYEGLRIATGFRADVVIDDLVIVELKIGEGHRAGFPQATADVHSAGQQATRVAD